MANYKWRKSEFAQASLDNLYQYFKKVNAGHQQASEDTHTMDGDNMQRENQAEQQENEFINYPFTYDDLLKAVNSLKYNKSCGVD